jgi:hypothetical protein
MVLDQLLASSISLTGFAAVRNKCIFSVANEASIKREWFIPMLSLYAVKWETVRQTLAVNTQLGEIHSFEKGKASSKVLPFEPTPGADPFLHRTN